MCRYTEMGRLGTCFWSSRYVKFSHYFCYLLKDHTAELTHSEKQQVERSPIFDREGPNVLTTVTIPLHTAILGGSVLVPTVDGDVELKVESGTQPFSKRILKGRGVADLSGKTRVPKKGDEIVTIKVEIPRSLTEAQKEKLREVFGLKKEAGEAKAKGGEKTSGVGSSDKEKPSSSSSSSSAAGDQSSKKSGSSFFRSAFDKIKDIKEGLHKEDGKEGMEGKKEAKGKDAA